MERRGQASQLLFSQSAPGPLSDGRPPARSRSTEASGGKQIYDLNSLERTSYIYVKVSSHKQKKHMLDHWISSKTLQCDQCSSVLDRDCNGARNILLRAMREGNLSKDDCKMEPW
jgi:hypothetical protein